MIKYNELQNIFLKLTYLLRGFTLEDYDNPDSPAQNLISLAYQTNSQPFQAITDGISYMWINYSDSPTNKITNSNENDYEGNAILNTKSQLRTIEVHWIFYGEQAHDLAFELRQKLLSYEVKDYLDKYSIKLIPTIPEVVLVFEEINGLFWPRVEYSVQYYLETSFGEILDTFSTVKIDIETKDANIHKNIE